MDKQEQSHHTLPATYEDHSAATVLSESDLKIISNCVRTMNLAAGGHSTPDTLLNHAEQLRGVGDKLAEALGATAFQNTQ